MSGKGNVRFSELFADTVETHGWDFAHKYYTGTHGMRFWEFQFWARQSQIDGWEYYMI